MELRSRLEAKMRLAFHRPKAGQLQILDEKFAAYEALSLAARNYTMAISASKPGETRHAIAEEMVRSCTEAQRLLLADKDNQALKVMTKANNLMQRHISEGAQGGEQSK